MEVTKHGSKRIRDRVGVNKRAVERVAKKAFEEGLTHAEAKGNLRRWMSMTFRRYVRGNQMRIYGEKLYIFHNDRLITVIDVPSNLKGLIKESMESRKSENLKNP